MSTTYKTCSLLLWFLVSVTVGCQRSPTETVTTPAPTAALVEATSVALATGSPTATPTPALAEVVTVVAPIVTIAPAPENMTVHMQVVFDFLTALQNGLTGADSGQYLSQDLTAAVMDGRPLPTLVGVRDTFPSFELADLTDNSLISGAIVRARFNYDFPSYAIFRLLQEEGEWRIRNIMQHNLVRTAATRDLFTAEFTIVNYYQALANDELDGALALLTGEAQTTFTADALTPRATGLRRVTITTLQPVRATNDQITIYVRLFVSPNTAQPGPWQAGDNPRWITLARTDAGWRIAQIVNSPILADIKTWQRVNILPIDMTVDIPSDWTRISLDWAWSPNSGGLPAIGVVWADLGDFDNDDALLPRHGGAISEQPIDLGWAQGTQYTFEQIGGVGEEASGAQTHMVVRTGRRAYGFYAMVNSAEELDKMRPILQRMVAAVVIHDPGAMAYNSIEATTSFLATLLRDSSGASSLPYLNMEKLTGGSDYQSLLNLLGVSTIYRSFQATWLENTAVGEAKILVTLDFADGSIQTRLFTVQLDDGGVWRIVKIDKEG